MELKNITKLETQYPTEQQIDKKELKKNIPTKWTKLGLTAFIFNLMMSGKAFAEKNPFVDFDKTKICGGGPVEVDLDIIPKSVHWIGTTLHILLMIMAIITIIQTIKFKINKKKDLDEEQLSKSKKRAIIFAKITAILIIIDVFFVMIGRDILIELF